MNHQDISELFDPVKIDGQIETRETINPRQIRLRGKREMITRLRAENAAALIDRLPQENEFFHITSNGKFDYWQLVPLIIKMAEIKGAALHASTWTINRENALEMLAMLDDGRLSEISLLTGLYFKRRESAVYATISNGLHHRGSRMRCLENHAKVAAISLPDGSGFVIEGSANFTANPRIEQNIVARSRELYQHHTGWINECFDL
jgi:hypothetical protein